MHLKRIRDAGANRHRQILERHRGRWRKNDLECHSGQIVARFIETLKSTERLECPVDDSAV
jgi:hypothetical protein